ncbi:MAG: response regulator [Nitrospirae bacterium YQR-1]
MKDKVESFREAFISKLPEKIETIKKSWERGLSIRWEKEAVREMHRLLHSLTGVFSILDFKELKNKSTYLESLLKTLIEKDYEPQPQVKLELERGLKGILEAGDTAVAASQYPQPHSSIAATAYEILPKPVVASSLLSKKPVNKNLIFLITEKNTDNLSSMLDMAGFTVEMFNKVTEITLNEYLPLSIIIDTAFPYSEMQGYEYLNVIREEIFPEVPVIFISDTDEINSRLQVARLGGLALYKRPVNFKSLTDRLREMASVTSIEPYRILIVDDEEDVAKYYASILKYAGMETTAVTNSFDVLKELAAFNPDLILMDMYMPGCTGLELAVVIRQIEDYMSIPIVFLSGETNVDAQLWAMSTGADDFITKNIQTEHLISSVTIRAERMRMLRSINRLRDYNQTLEFMVEERTKELVTTCKTLREKSSELEELNRHLEERVKLETEKRLESEQLLVHRSRLADMGEMLNAIAHQWKQPLNNLFLLIQDLDFAFNNNEIDKEYVDKVISEGTNQITFMIDTVEDFKNFLKPDKLKADFSVKGAIDSILKLMDKKFVMENVEIVVEGDDNIMVFGYSNEFKQVILNLLQNSLDAFDKICITTKRKILITIVKKETKAVISIQDNAGGIPPEIKDSVFDSYFTTKKEGTGIGLYMSKVIIERGMDGKMYVENVAAGANFIIELPAVT